MEDVGQQLSRPPRIAVLGAGWAGLAAAVTLCDAGHAVVVFEAARTPGGRARRVEYRGLPLDNGLHILIGAYVQTLALMRKVNGKALPLHTEPLDLHFPGRFRLRTPPAPAPLHLALGLLCCAGLSLRERVDAARFMARLRRMEFRLACDESVTELLRRCEQSDASCRYLWHPLCIAALNTRPAEASAQIFLNVLRDSLAGPRAASTLLLPSVDLGSLFPDSAVNWLNAHGSSVRLGCPVAHVSMEGGHYVVSGAEGIEHFDTVICALSPYRVAQVLGDLLPAPTTHAIAKLRYEPIYSIYIQYEAGARLPQSMIGLDGRLGHWAFDRGRLCGQDGLIAVVISASGPHEALDHDSLAIAVSHELAKDFPFLRTPIWHKVIAEKRATFACVPGMERPDQTTGVPGLFLAGDYTASPYPGTLEAATRSGVRCARAILEGKT
ncbi:MAG TPA: hydroxysqualene dehydroxylase HpnE [Burkholderiales bacterium]|nr:hydroxysqualene dehydroxylase HpnE [Burkholderiales bacterium]